MAWPYRRSRTTRVVVDDQTYEAYRALAKLTGLSVPILAHKALQRAIPSGEDFARELAQLEAGGDPPDWFRNLLPVDDPETFLAKNRGKGTA